MAGILDNVFQSFNTLIAPGQFHSLFKAYRETAAVTFGLSTAFIGVPQMSKQWAAMMDSEFARLKGKLLDTFNVRAFNDVGASGKIDSANSAWNRWTTAYKVNSVILKDMQMLLNPGVIWSELERLAIALDAVNGGEAIKPTDTVEALKHGASMANEAGKAVIAAAGNGLQAAGEAAFGFVKKLAIGAAVFYVALMIVSRKD